MRLSHHGGLRAPSNPYALGMAERSLILASGSPARLRLLRDAGFEPKVVVSGIDEDDVEAEDTPSLVTILAERKADAVADPDGEAVVVACDSMLEFGGQAHGKPSSESQARQWLRAMRGRSGTLFTGHCVIDEPTGRRASGVAATIVRFGVTSDAELDAYLASGEALAVAGAFTLDGRSAPFIDGGRRRPRKRDRAVPSPAPLATGRPGHPDHRPLGQSRVITASTPPGAMPVPPASVPPASTLKLGPIAVDPPVVLAPMAGVTNIAFRRLCRTFGAGLYVSEMVTARALVEGNAKTLGMASFGADEPVRSVQLCGVDPAVMGTAVRRLVDEVGVDHIDLNFGCPAAKVTRQGGGAALPAHRALFRSIVRAAVDSAGSVPVTVKMRIGVDATHVTFIEAGQIAEDEGVAAITLHARTAEQLYSGSADWGAIGELKSAITSIPVLGNGDLWEASDALAMVAATGCDGVVVGRGCLGRPWLFRDLADAFAGRPLQGAPTLGETIHMMRTHAELLCDAFGADLGVRQFRKHSGWYLTGLPVGSCGSPFVGPGQLPGEVHGLLRRPRPRSGLPSGGHAHGPWPHQRSEAGPSASRLARPGRRSDAARGRLTSWCPAADRGRPVHRHLAARSACRGCPAGGPAPQIRL